MDKNSGQNKKIVKKVNKVQMHIIYLFIGLLVFIIGVMARYAWVQIVRGDEMLSRLESQVQESSVLHVPRGTIYDAEMKELAISTMVSSLYIDPNHVEDPEQTARDVAPLIGLTEKDILDDIAQGGGFVWVKRQMEPEETKALKNLMKEKPEYVACLGFIQESKRYYPNDMLAANVIGFVGTDDKGLDGIEQQFDGMIKGEEQTSSIFTDALARPIMDSVFLKNSPVDANCKNIQLTINAQYQFIIEKALDKAMMDHGAESVTAIVMNPKNGDILAMASRPAYDPNNFHKYDPNVWKNRAVSDIYEPGSTFKSIVAAAGFQEKLVSPTDIFVDPGTIEVSGRTIQNWSGDSFGTVTFLDVVKNSINTGFAQLGLELGGERLMNYARKFGFGERTGIELPGEESGILFNPKDMVASDVATSSIGQSIAVTPLQMITAMSAIANDGVLLKPHIVKAIYNADGTVYQQMEREEVRRCIDSDVDKILKSVLEQVVSTGGGSKASIEGYHIAGKTGTAQKIDMVNGGYLPGHYIASFCGFGPVEDPQFTVLVIINDPAGGEYYGGQVAAPIAHDIFLQLFRYANVKPINGNQSLLDDIKGTEAKN
ncbi:penicillin-binding protein 2 [Megamonas funiformis]|jgi:stage V sporulation protein D (sporulation-specific penicillin-binding protein)|uniref:peptidoglycan D,D-transpeptidase FtsI family protein n=1 Tax=Megamonas funiformis TaxID=437897 RepID=UPI000E47DF3A|nr:penicillin-binding transpeptidase domain-containing protein [Megamonas funiformis]RHG07362.1 peptidoglycan glycosyltransferase [Megamonas funiformis]